MLGSCVPYTFLLRLTTNSPGKLGIPRNQCSTVELFASLLAPENAMPTISEALAIAIQHHQAAAGRPPQIYRQILAVDPDQPDAIHLLGVTAYEAGEHDVAVENIRRAIQLNGNVGAFHNNLGKHIRAGNARSRSPATAGH